MINWFNSLDFETKVALCVIGVAFICCVGGEIRYRIMYHKSLFF